MLLQTHQTNYARNVFRTPRNIVTVGLTPESFKPIVTLQDLKILKSKMFLKIKWSGTSPEKAISYYHFYISHILHKEVVVKWYRIETSAVCSSNTYSDLHTNFNSVLAIVARVLLHLSALQQLTIALNS